MIESGFINADCMDYLKDYPDNYFDLCIADPPYGDASESSQQTRPLRFHGGDRWNKYTNGKSVEWDIAPQKLFFDEIFRISRNQIIWGGNFFELPPTRCFLIWRKLTISERFSMAMAEYAWTSFNANAKVYEKAPQDPTGQRFHPTEKPLDLYLWLINNFAKDGDKILDPMCGSGNSLIACHRIGHDYVGFEINPQYYKKAKARLNDEKAMMNIFDYLKE